MQPKFYTTQHGNPDTNSDNEKLLDKLFERGDRYEIEKYYKKALDDSTVLFDKYAGKKRPNFEFTSDPNVQTAYFAVDKRGGNPEIKVGLDFFVKNKLSAEQAVWVLMHELTHFMDYAADRQEYMGQFKNAEKLGKEMADRLAEYYKDQSHIPGGAAKDAKPKELTPTQIDNLKRRISKIYSSGYYNIINDIYVNHNVATSTDYTHNKDVNPNTKQGEVVGLYKRILFRDRDFSTLPEFYQYLYFLLRGENVPEGMRVTEAAEVSLAKDYQVQYKKKDKRRGIEVLVEKVLNTEEIINTFLNPNSDDQLEGDIKETKLSNRKDTSLKYRSEYVDSTLLPTFSELLFNDLKNRLDEMLEDRDFEKMMKWLNDILDKMEECSPDFIPGEVIDRFADWKESDDNKDAERSKNKEIAEKKAKETQDKNGAQEKAKKEELDKKAKEKAKQKAIEDSIKNFAKQNNIAENVAERVAAARRDVAPYVDRLSELWKSITTGQGSESEIVADGEYKTGTEVNVDAFVRQFDTVVRAEFEKLRIMKRLEREDRPSDRPERIEVSLIIDQSGSMGNNESEKNKTVERVATLLQVSLDKFNQFLVNSKEKSKSKLHVDTEVIAFGNSAMYISPFRYTGADIEAVENDLNSGRKGVQNFKTIESIGDSMGFTYDDTALDKVMKNISPEIKEKILSGKIIKIVFEITDGGSSDSAATKEKIDNLTGDGVLVFAFQIGTVNEKERGIFEETWNASPDGVQRGYVVGENFAKLPEIIAGMLENFLGDVKIYE